MRCDGWPLAICSWSLRADVASVDAALRALQIDQVNLALKPAFQAEGGEYLAAVRRLAWKISATTIGFPQEDYSTLESIRATGGIVPDEHWQANRERVRQAMALTRDLGVAFITMHAGFLENDDPVQNRKVRDRLAELAEEAARRGIMLLLETGQETAAALRALFEELTQPALGVNFDPANMVLYGKGDPIDAVRVLGPWIKHVHVKDAVHSPQPARWGTETPWGEGEVGGVALLQALKRAGYQGTLAIERESGSNRFGDIQLAAVRLAEAGRMLAAGERP